MKRIMNGKTFNTTTSTYLATWPYTDLEGEVEARLYISKGGTFFSVHEWVEEARSEMRPKVRFYVMDRTEVDDLMQHADNLEIHDTTILPEPPEA
jgi:hypothetical protein